MILLGTAFFQGLEFLVAFGILYLAGTKIAEFATRKKVPVRNATGNEQGKV